MGIRSTKRTAARPSFSTLISSSLTSSRRSSRSNETSRVTMTPAFTPASTSSLQLATREFVTHRCVRTEAVECTVVYNMFSGLSQARHGTVCVLTIHTHTHTHTHMQYQVFGSRLYEGVRQKSKRCVCIVCENRFVNVHVLTISGQHHPCHCKG